MNLDPTEHSFSEAYGYADLPQQLKLGELPEKARIGFWNAFYSTFEEHYNQLPGIDYEWLRLLAAAHARHFNMPLDTFSDRPERILDFYKRHFLQAKINEVFDSLLFLVRSHECPFEFLERVQEVCVIHRLAYIFDIETRTIFQASTPEEGQATVAAVKELSEYGLNGACQHLRQAADFMNEGRWERSVHESISAVESVGVQIAPKGEHLRRCAKKPPTTRYVRTSSTE